MYTRCLNCGSDKIVPNRELLDQGFSYPADSHAVMVERNPGAFIYKDRVMSPLVAHVCGDCGYTALIATQADELYQAYQSAQHR